MAEKQKRIVVTGLGVVSCFGNDVEKFYDDLLAGKSGIAPIEKFECDDLPTRFAAYIKDFTAEPYLDKRQAKRVDDFIAYAMVAGKKAAENAGLNEEALEKLDKKRCGVLIGSGMGGMDTFAHGVQTVTAKGFKRLTPFFIPYIITNMSGALLAMDLGFMGPNYSISTACATGNYCVYSAANHIRKGEADIMICGGAEAPISYQGLAGFVAIKALSKRNDSPETACRPWDKSRDGFVMGEGCGVLVLEELEHALARGAPIYAEYLGGSVSCDAHHITDPRADGLGVAMCIEKALEEGGVTKEDVNYINAHATGTPVGDMAEVNAIKRVFGPLCSNLKMNATKSMIGHCLGAAGGLESVATVMAIKRQKLHPTKGIFEPEEGLGDIDPVKDEAQDLPVKVALNNSFGFGGHNSTLAFGSYKNG